MAKRVSGNHNPDEVLLGIHASPEFKALISVVANTLDQNITDTIIDALMRLARTQGIVDDDYKVKAEYKDIVILKAEQIRAAKKIKQKKAR